ncbi:MAG: translation initiation factor IF-6 [Candidatus Thermoplasmatota archaeon]|nr:translation initiation factor IF-6 [Candidatus Thermoplasmatota archaeon]
MKQPRFSEQSKFQRLDFLENPNIGVFCKATDDFCIIRKGLPKKILNRVFSALQARLIELQLADANIVGSLLVCNSHGVVISNIVNEADILLLESNGFSVLPIDDTINAVGNDILINDSGGLIHPDIKDTTVKKIQDCLQVPLTKGLIAGLDTVGMAAVATNKGVLCHPVATDSEKNILESIFKVPVMIGTVNHGVPLIGSGLVANSHGAVVGSLTTGIEMGRIEEALQLIR